MIARPEAPAVARLIAAYYAKPGNEAGGPYCHVVLDDGNIGDDFVRSTLADCEASGDADGTALMQLFSQMKQTGRRKAIALAMGGRRE